ncbi:MAG: exodeoxyribonuclease V subunit gamma [Planctomycetota bacterium]
MALQVSYVERLADVLDHAVEFLERERDLFARPRIIVPTPGAKAWLTGQLAVRLGAAGRADGVVANVDLLYPGAIVSLVQPHRDRAADPWSFDRLTFAVLDAITGPAAAELGIPFDVAREPLLAARRIAGLFDNYHARRPAMILLWEKDRPALSPMATPRDPEGSGGELAAADLWQFATWRAVRRTIDQPSPPARIGLAHFDDRSPLLVIGLQSLSLQQITCLKLLGSVGDVRALLVHPSPTLQGRWAGSLPPISEGVPPKREAAELPEELDPLVAAWLHGARETQVLLASQGIRPEHVATSAAAPEPTALLARMQRSVVSAAKPAQRNHDRDHDRDRDRSFTIHRCHSLARQAEVLHDAILHAFVDLDGLQPQEVVIVSPCLDRLAPPLQAVFAREVVGADGRKARLPLVVADRGLHEVSPAAELLLHLLPLVGSRCSVEQFRGLAKHPLVRRQFGIDDDQVRCWDQLVARGGIHWGFDADHRIRGGFPDAAAEPHTWRSGLERMLLGGLLPDAAPRPELGGTVPLADVPLSDLPAITTLIRIFDVVLALDAAAAAARPVAGWCAAIEEAAFALCGADAAELVEPLRELRSLRDAASGTAVPFADVREILTESLRAAAGRQPLCTGAITATSLVPLRDVPFRVVCIAGYDDGTVTAADARADDLVARQPLTGDGVPRLDVRRSLLDALLAARDRVVITCNGMSIKNNVPLHLVTPLAELVDFAVRHGVGRTDPGQPSGVEVVHPRHAVGSRNFVAGQIVPGLIWSHDQRAFEAARELGGDAPPQPSRPAAGPELPVVELAMLEDMVRDPLGLYLRKTLGIGTYRDDEEFPPATFPLVLPDREMRTLTRELLTLLVEAGGPVEDRVRDWLAAVRAAGRLPFGRFGDAALREIQQLARGIAAAATQDRNPVPLTGFETVPTRIQLPGRLLTGHVPGFHRPTNQLVEIRVTRAAKDSWGLPLHVAGLRLLAARAAGVPAAQATVVARHEQWKVDAARPAMIARTVRLHEGLDGVAAAKERLAAICDLLPQALAAPYGRFGSAADKVAAGDDDAARAAFGQHVDWRYRGSAEELVYGPRPRFDDVFGPAAPERAFHAAFAGLLSITGRYVLS